MQEIREIRTDYVDDENLRYVDVWFSDDDNAGGKSIAVVDLDTNKVIFFDNAYRLNERIKEAINEILSENILKDVNVQQVIKTAKELVTALLEDEGQTKLNVQNPITGKNEHQLLWNLHKALENLNEPQTK